MCVRYRLGNWIPLTVSYSRNDVSFYTRVRKIVIEKLIHRTADGKCVDLSTRSVTLSPTYVVRSIA